MVSIYYWMIYNYHIRLKPDRSVQLQIFPTIEYFCAGKLEKVHGINNMVKNLIRVNILNKHNDQFFNMNFNIIEKNHI